MSGVLFWSAFSAACGCFRLASGGGVTGVTAGFAVGSGSRTRHQMNGPSIWPEAAEWDIHPPAAVSARRTPRTPGAPEAYGASLRGRPTAHPGNRARAGDPVAKPEPITGRRKVTRDSCNLKTSPFQYL
jgi:hypothetical protein